MNPGKPRHSRQLYEFGDFRLDPSERIFARNGERIPLAPKAFDTLLILVQHSGRVLTKEELIKALWPNSFVEENNLTQHISALRRALGNGSANYIETVPKLGYRFASKVREIGDPPTLPEESEAIGSRRTRIVLMERDEIEDEEGKEPPDVQHTAVAIQPDAVREIATPMIQRPVQRWKKWGISIAALVLVSVASVSLAIRSFRRPSKVPASASPRSLAVLPLRNLKPDPETDFLSLALTDAVISRLGYVREINLEPLSSVAKYRNSDVNARQIARELNVQNVLAGSYLKEGDDLRVTIEFINVAKDADPWRENLELKYDRLLTVQDRGRDERVSFNGGRVAVGGSGAAE